MNDFFGKVGSHGTPQDRTNPFTPNVPAGDLYPFTSRAYTQYRREIAGEGGGDGQGKPRKHAAAQATLFGLDGSVFVVLQREPVDLAIEHAPEQIFRHPGAAIADELLPRIARDTARGDFDDQLRRTGKVTVLINGRFAAMCGIEKKHCIGLRHIIGIQANGDVRCRGDFRM